MSVGPNRQVTVSARVGFHTVEGIPEQLEGIHFPVELALPWQYPMWQAAIPQWDEMVTALKHAGLAIPSVHATQGRISDPSFLSWGLETCRLAEQLGATVVTVHPNRDRKNRADSQGMARRHLRELQRATFVVISVETFEGSDRVLSPSEIMSLGLPMTLDTSHIRHIDEVMSIIQSYWRHIPVVHLSAQGQGEHHLPVDDFCLQAVRQLIGLSWSGTIVLEYLPQYAGRIRSDIDRVEKVLG
jgi:sugar phosphate isomerase/epimerase